MSCELCVLDWACSRSKFNYQSHIPLSTEIWKTSWRAFKMCFWSCKGQLTPVTVGLFIAGRQPFLCPQAAPLLFCTWQSWQPFPPRHPVAPPFSQILLALQLIRQIPVCSAASLCLPPVLDSFSFTLYSRTTSVSLASLWGYELWLDYQICAWSIYLFIFPELAFSISSFLLEFFILDVPLLPSLELTLLEEVYYLPFHWGFLLVFLFLLTVYFPSYTE